MALSPNLLELKSSLRRRLIREIACAKSSQTHSCITMLLQERWFPFTEVPNPAEGLWLVCHFKVCTHGVYSPWPPPSSDTKETRLRPPCHLNYLKPAAKPTTNLAAEASGLHPCQATPPISSSHSESVLTCQLETLSNLQPAAVSFLQRRAITCPDSAAF